MSDTQVKEEVKPVEKYPTLRPMVEKLEKEKAEILAKSSPLRQQRDQLLREIQPLEAKLQKIDAEIHKIERPRLGEIHNELSGLARAMGGRSMNSQQS